MRLVPPGIIPSLARSITPGRKLTSEKLILADTLLFLHISIRCPTSPNPVTSVTALGLNFWRVSDAFLFNIIIDLTADSITVSLAFSFFIAVEITPVPIGFVSIKLSLGLAPVFVHKDFSETSPVTTSPYLGSLSSIEWPPTIGIPASIALSAPPCMISDKIVFESF